MQQGLEQISYEMTEDLNQIIAEQSEEIKQEKVNKNFINESFQQINEKAHKMIHDLRAEKRQQ